MARRRTPRRTRCSLFWISQRALTNCHWVAPRRSSGPLRTRNSSSDAQKFVTVSISELSETELVKVSANAVLVLAQRLRHVAANVV